MQWGVESKEFDKNFQPLDFYIHEDLVKPRSLVYLTGDRSIPFVGLQDFAGVTYMLKENPAEEAETYVESPNAILFLDRREHEYYLQPVHSVPDPIRPKAEEKMHAKMRVNFLRKETEYMLPNGEVLQPMALVVRSKSGLKLYPYLYYQYNGAAQVLAPTQMIVEDDETGLPIPIGSQALTSYNFSLERPIHPAREYIVTDRELLRLDALNAALTINDLRGKQIIPRGDEIDPYRTLLLRDVRKAERALGDLLPHVRHQYLANDEQMWQIDFPLKDRAYERLFSKANAVKLGIPEEAKCLGYPVDFGSVLYVMPGDNTIYYRSYDNKSGVANTVGLGLYELKEDGARSITFSAYSYEDMSVLLDVWPRSFKSHRQDPNTSGTF